MSLCVKITLQVLLIAIIKKKIRPCYFKMWGRAVHYPDGYSPNSLRESMDSSLGACMWCTK